VLLVPAQAIAMGVWYCSCPERCQLHAYGLSVLDEFCSSITLYKGLYICRVNLNTEQQTEKPARGKLLIT